MLIFIPMLILNSVSLLNSQKRADPAAMSTKAIEIMGMETGYKCTQADRDSPFLSHSLRAPRSRRPPGIRLIVSGVSRDTSWQVCNSPLLLDIRNAFRDLFYSRRLSRTCIIFCFVCPNLARPVLHIRGCFRSAPPRFLDKGPLSPRVLPYRKDRPDAITPLRT